MEDKYGIKLMDCALRDLDDIYAYVARTLQEPGTALRLAEAIEGELFSLETMPYRCPERQTGMYANKGYRHMFIKNYTAIYRIDEQNNTVIIVTIRDSPRQF